MGRIYLLWWALLIGSGLTGLLLAVFDLKGNGRLTQKGLASLTSVLLAAAALWACPAMALFEYDGMSCSESRYGLSWMLLAAAASTLVLAFRAKRAKRAQEYLKHKSGPESHTP